MARMIPPHIDPGCSSPGEKEIFLRIRDDPGTNNWTVLHSLAVAQHKNLISGEIDFVILVPGKGVLCVEVKACWKLARSHGEWFYGRTSKGDPRGPFRQASDAMHSVRQRIAELRPDLSRILFWSAVIFPYLSFKQESGEWHTWQVIDRSIFRARPLSSSLATVLDKARDFLQQCATAKWFQPFSKEPYPEQCDDMAALLRPEFEVFESRKSRVSRLNDELKKYTEEQFGALDAMETNPRVAFIGPAGTGKTVLAMEAAQRAVSRGHSVLLLCFNKLLARWLQQQTADLAPLLVANTLHAYMLEIAGSGIQPSGKEFWENSLPTLAIDKLIACESVKNVFDELIVDEAQDLLKDNYLDFLDLSLKGGLSSGTWRFLGDFEKQAIYDPTILPVDQVLQKRAVNVPIYSLRTNCRNTPRVAELARLLGGLNPNYTKVLRPDDGVEPEPLYYKSGLEQQNLLIAALEDIYAAGFSADEIVVLSTKSENSCASSIATNPWKQRLRPADTATPGHIRYCSVHAFKGREAPVVIVTDVERISDQTAASLFYIAVTRTLLRLVIFISESAKSDVVDILMTPA